MKRFCMVLLILLLALWPVGAFAAQPLEDGQYTIEVSLAGGTGRASITSPAQLAVAGEVMTVTIEWSSPYYEYMLVDGIYYDPIQTEGNSTFEIPVMLDEDMPVSAQTIAMSQPHEIDYVLRFDSSTLKPMSNSITTWQIVLIVAAVCVGIVMVISVVVAAKRQTRGTTKEGNGTQ